MPEDRALQVTDQIWTSAGTTDSHLVAAPGGDVVINTGYHYQGPRHRERYEEGLGRPLDVRAIVLTQSYPEQLGGWSAFTGPGVETIAQSEYAEGRLDRALLPGFFRPRTTRVLSRLGDGMPISASYSKPVEPEITTYFDDHHELEVDGRRFELLSVPGGESLDGVAVWLPEERAVFTGNLFGALYGALPHLYTIRGTKQRSARLFLRSLQRILDLEPEIHITGHGAPVFGADRIRGDLELVAEATAYVHDRTVEGMNDGKDLWTLMEEIELPDELAVAPGRGPVWWYVRAVWEEYTGWFRFESTTELYPTPARSVWPEVVELAGGPDVLADRAARHVRDGDPHRALHLLDMTLAVDAGHRPSLSVQLDALELLLERAGNNFDELHYLETEIARCRAALDGDVGPA